MTTKITDKNISNIANMGIEWQSKVTSDGSTVTQLSAGKGYFIDNTSAAGIVKLPAPDDSNAGDSIAIKDYAGNFGTNNLTIQRNTNIIQGTENDGKIITNRASLVLVYVDSTKGWIYTNESNVADLQLAEYVAATGGTVTTSGNFKIHTFTGDGCFVVSSVGNSVGSNTADYLVVAGGGSGGIGNSNDGGGGGGAGGYRESSGTASGCYTVSPLGACVAALPVSVTTYPVTVGGGGTQPGVNCSVGAKGSNSVFSTITSAGGGGGDANGPTPNFAVVSDGGSGGGGHQNSGGTGNTPPVSPSQGNNGGPSGSPSGAGGGGALAVGEEDQPSDGGGAGGGGATSNITNTPTARAGGGGGANSPNRGGNPGTNGGAGGSGGGGAGQNAGTNGTANTGGGGGGAANSNSGNGGKGLVVIRYKFQ
jgi:hypothetical protein